MEGEYRFQGGGGRKSEIPITFGPVHAEREPYFAVSLSIVVHVNLLYLHNEVRAARGETRLIQRH